MATPVELPKLGNTVEECIVAGWRKRKGDAVSAGEVIADIETDKTTFELPAPAAGTLLEIFFEQGALVPVFTNLCVIGAPGESVDAFRPKSAASASASAAISEPASAFGVRQPPGALASTSSADSTTPAVPGTSEAFAAALSPRAARFAREQGIDPSTVIGSGPGGRILEADLRKAVASAPVPAARPVTRPAATAGGSRVSTIREKIAQRMRESLASTAQYTLNGSGGAAGLLRVRARLKEAKETAHITINDLVTFCVVRALLEVPELNAEFINGAIRKHAEVHIGFACDTPRGLMVPVIRNAHRLTLSELATRTKDLAAQAVAGRISADDLSGATFTISNLGNLGIETFTPLLNPPQVAILGVGAIGVKVVRRQGVIAFVDSIGLSLTCDHQVIDGAPGARFLQVVSEKIEQVESLVNLK